MGKSYYYLFYKYDFFTKKNCVGFYSKSFMITEIGLSCSALFSLSSANGASQTESVCQKNKNESPAAYTTPIKEGTLQNRAWTLFKNNFQISRRFFPGALLPFTQTIWNGHIWNDSYFVENHILLKVSRINIKQKNLTLRGKDPIQQPVAKSSKISRREWKERNIMEKKQFIQSISSLDKKWRSCAQNSISKKGYTSCPLWLSSTGFSCP